MQPAMRFDVPSDWKNLPPVAASCRRPHQLEREVQRRILADGGLSISSLVIRRIRDGVCLEGVLESPQSSSQVESIARTVEGVQRVLNCLVVRNQTAGCAS